MNKKECRTPLLLLLGLYTLFAVLVGVSQYVANDFVLSATILFDVLDVTTRYIEIAGSALLVALCLHFVYCHGFAASRTALLAMGGVLLFKYLASVLAVSIIYGSIDLTGGLLSYTVALLMDVALIALALLLAYRLILPAKAGYEERKKAAATLGRPFDEKDPIFPFGALLSFKNPVLLTLFVSSATLLLFHAVSFLSLFISGSPLLAEDIPVMLVYLVILVLLPCTLSYFVARGAFSIAARHRQ